MRKLILIALITILPTAAALADSMEQFRSLIEYTLPSATDFNAISGPEILSVNHYPSNPGPGDAFIVRATVRCYDSMVSYKIARVELTIWNPGGEKATLEMELEDSRHGIYSLKMPPVREGDEIFYTVRAVDDRGNVALELPPDGDWSLLIDDPEDTAINPALDIRRIAASSAADGSLSLCQEASAPAKSTLGTEIPIYGMFLFGEDFRYKNELTENELATGWVAAYLPFMSVKDLAPASELFALFTSGGEKKKRAEFAKKGNRLCYTFSPSIIREDYALGIKIIGLTISATTSPFAIKPTDSTRVVMLYPAVHSFRVNMGSGR